MTSGLLFEITLLYIVFVDNGLTSAGMGGVILSLIPSVVTPILGYKYLIKEKIFEFMSSASTDQEKQVQEVNQTTAIQDDNDEERPLLQVISQPNTLG